MWPSSRWAAQKASRSPSVRDRLRLPSGASGTPLPRQMIADERTIRVLALVDVRP